MIFIVLPLLFLAALAVSAIVVPRFLERRYRALLEDAPDARLSVWQRLREYLRWLLLALLTHLFPNERPTDEELMRIGREQERERAEVRIAEAESRYQSLVEETPTVRIATPVRSPRPSVPFPEPEAHTDAFALKRLREAWWHGGREPETEKSPATRQDWWKG